jgi:hypothetical protein
MKYEKNIVINCRVSVVEGYKIRGAQYKGNSQKLYDFAQDCCPICVEGICLFGFHHWFEMFPVRSRNTASAATLAIHLTADSFVFFFGCRLLYFYNQNRTQEGVSYLIHSLITSLKAGPNFGIYIFITKLKKYNTLKAYCKYIFWQWEWWKEITDGKGRVSVMMFKLLELNVMKYDVKSYFIRLRII